MILSQESSSKARKVLIVTSSGGGGLLQAANAKAQEVLQAHPGAVVLQRDVMKDWMWKWIGRLFVSFYNSPQRRGNVKLLQLWAWLTPVAEYIFWPHIFVCSLYTLYKEDVDQVLDTQVMGTSAILKAIRIFNRHRKKALLLEKVLVDLPTKKATHFFYPIKQLSERDRSLIRLITVAPLLEKGETKEQFWEKNCRLSHFHLRYEDYYVRQAFRRYRHRQREEGPFWITTTHRSQEEGELIQKCVQRGSIQAQRGEGKWEFTIAPQDRVFTILLGSQPASNATYLYVKRMMELYQEMQGGPNCHLFVFCSHHRPGEESLLRRVAELVARTAHYPTALSVIPMSFQSEETIAPLFFRSDVTCTRSGGQTAMELMCTSRGEIWVHSEAKGAGPLSNEDLLKGIPGWESANAAYLQHHHGAKLVTPENFLLQARSVLCARSVMYRANSSQLASFM